MGDNIWLQRPTGDVPWGFRISGGRDFQEPIRVSRVSGGSIASSSLVNGDVLSRIGNSDASCLTHSQANDIIKNSGNTLQLCVVKGNTQDSVQNTQAASQFSTKLEQQLANMDLSYGGSNPTTPQSPYTPSMRGYQSPGASQQPGYQHSPHSQNSPGYHPLANIPPPPPSQPPPPMYNSYSPVSPPPSHMQQHSPGQKIPPKVPEKPAMPDAVLNMAAKGGTDKKPFAYAADMDEIKHHREKVRRKPVSIPSYQNILNLPQFDDSPAGMKIKPYHPPAPKYEPETPPIPAGPGEGVVAHAQYNTPLGLYSAENAEEAFKAQSGGLVTGVDGLPGTKEKKDITESATYKMIHGISAPKPKPKITVPAHTVNHPPRGPAPDDEMTFSGVLRPTDIPSKSFHRLQSLTDHGDGGGSEIDRTSIRPQHHLAADDGGVGGYDEASIRYLGKNIPSRSFRMLQNMTGGADQPMPGPASAARRHQHRKREDVEQEEPEKHNDEIVDISYVGGNIPSRSFKMLQQQIGEPNDTSTTHTEGNVKVAQATTGQQSTPAADSRRQRRRQRNKELQDTNTPNENEEHAFDENAYLSGNVKIVSGSVNNPPPARSVSKVEVIRPETDEPPVENQREFDEEAFLSGRLGILSDQPKPFSPKKKDFKEKAPWEKENDDDDENRRAQLFQDEPFSKKGDVQRELAPWERPDDDFHGRANLADLNLNKEIQRERAPWEKSTPTEDRQFDEDRFLKRPSIDQQQQVDSPVENGVPNGNFDEAAFLQGKVPLVSGDGDSNSSFHLSQQYKKPTAFRERAPWEKPDTDEEGEGEFDERAFLAGKVAVVNQGERRSSYGKSRFSQVPSKTFLRLTRSVSREQSPSVENTSDYLSADDDDRSSTSDASDIRYVGHKIPSRTFLKLHRSMERRSAEPEPSGADDFRQNILDDNVPNQVENVTIETKDPEVYLDQLKQSMQNMEGNVKIAKVEPQAEATDF